MSNRKMLCLLLGKLNVCTEMAEDGADVVDMASDGRLGRFNLIFMDNQMPRMVRLTFLWIIPVNFRFPVLLSYVPKYDKSLNTSLSLRFIVWQGNGSEPPSAGM